MKKVFIAPITLFCLFLFSCGPSAAELKRLQEIEDSIAKVERENAIDKASQLLEQADSLAADSLINDSTLIDTIKKTADTLTE